MELAGINPLYLIAGLALLGLAPFLLMMVTSYVKIVVVTSLVRNALGVQQVPPAMVMNGLAIILTVFILVPAFTITELTKAFQIGFLLYLPFVAIDLIISNVLLAMGMMMVSPMTISLPFKLLLFVTLDGWLKISQGLLLSYQ